MGREVEERIRSTPTGWRRPTGRLICVGYFLQKSSIMSGSFAKNDVQLEASYASSPPCTSLSLCVYISLYVYTNSLGKCEKELGVRLRFCIYVYA